MANTITYILAWPTARRRNAFVTAKAKKLLYKLLKEECKKRGWEIATCVPMPWGVSNLMVRVQPRNSAHEVVSRLKRATSVMRSRVKSLNTWPSMWTNDYVAHSGYSDGHFREVDEMLERVKSY